MLPRTQKTSNHRYCTFSDRHSTWHPDGYRERHLPHQRFNPHCRPWRNKVIGQDVPQLNFRRPDGFLLQRNFNRRFRSRLFVQTMQKDDRTAYHLRNCPLLCVGHHPCYRNCRHRDLVLQPRSHPIVLHRQHHQLQSCFYFRSNRIH